MQAHEKRNTELSAKEMLMKRKPKKGGNEVFCASKNLDFILRANRSNFKPVGSDVKKNFFKEITLSLMRRIV